MFSMSEQRWIPTSEQLPIRQPIAAAYVEARVLAWDGRKVFEACYTAFHDPNDNGWSAPREGTILPPIFWQWLPEPPKTV